MSEPEARARPRSETVPPPGGRGPAVLRALAAAFAHLADFDRFVAGLQTALNHAEWFGRVNLEIEGMPATPETQFALGEMTVPVQGPAGAHGLLRVSSQQEQRFYGPEDLHLLAGLADFLAAVLDRAREWREVERQRRMFGFLLNQAPVGILAFDERHHIFAANDLARRWLGGGADLWGALQAALPEGVTVTAPPTPGGFHLRTEGRLVYGELRVSGGRVGVLVLTDLSADQARLHDALRRETYRCQWRGLRLCFALLDSGGPAGRLLRELPALGAELPGSMTVGPYDARRLGLVFPETGWTAAIARLRHLRALRDVADVRAGLAELGRDGGEPEALLQSALAHLRPLAEVVRPVLLLHDDSPEVNEALAFVLGRDFEVVTSSNLELTRRLLQTRAFDAIVTEIDLRSASGLELARMAAGAQPGIRPFFTTVSEMPAEAKADPALADAVVFQKPFDVRALARTVREKLQMAGDPPA